MCGVRFLGRLLVQILANAVGLVIAAATLDGVSLDALGLLIDVAIFTGVSVLVLPLIQKQAIRRSEVLAGSSALLTCLVALIVTVVLSDGLQIRGVANWIATTVIVWATALLVGILLPWALARRAIARRRNDDRPSGTRTWG